MQQLMVECVDGMHREKVYTVKELSLLGHLLSCKESKKNGITYLEIPCAFDIETTNIFKKDENGNIDPDFRPYAFMYHWQFCIDDEVCFGRTWREFQTLLNNLTDRMNLDDKHRLVIFSHNLNFEWQFFRRFVHFKEGFFKDERVPLKIVLDGGIEFRDSYALSNMTLAKFCENEPGVIHYKLSGDDFDYLKLRLPSTIMSDYELSYCYNDVRGLCECIRSRMNEDALAHMPMTSTGYVRRDARIAMKKNPNNRRLFESNALTPHLYTMCREAFRGGDTHANIRHADQLLHEVDSYDIQSSFPACMMINRFPVAPFFKITPATFFNRDLSDYALLIQCRFTDIKYVGTCGMPYIPLSKCKAITPDKVIDNGRVLFGSALEMIITDVDLDITLEDYVFNDFYIKEVYAARYGYLSDEYKSVIMKYYRSKTELKGVENKVYEYNKEKNKLNGCYGMMVQQIDHSTTIYNGHDYETTDCNLEETIKKYYKGKNNFLSYQQGLFVTCHARKRLKDMQRVIGKDCVYCDTDSIKCINDHHEDFEKKNQELIKEAEAAGAYAVDKNGVVQYMGIWDHETKKHKYDDFKTLGAKKYVVRIGEDYVSTIAGVNKKVGSRFFKDWGIDAFENGTRIKDSGHLSAFYNDDEIHTITINGEEIETASNVALVDNTYTLGVTDEYFDLLEKALDNVDDMYYI